MGRSLFPSRLEPVSFGLPDVAGIYPIAPIVPDDGSQGQLVVGDSFGGQLAGSCHGKQMFCLGYTAPLGSRAITNANPTSHSLLDRLRPPRPPRSRPPR